MENAQNIWWPYWSLLPFRDNQVRWHAETNYGHLPPYRRLQCLLIETITFSFTIQRQSSLMAHGDHHGHPHLFYHLETIKYDGTRRPHGHPHLFYYLETIKSDGMQRPSWSSAPFLLSRDNQVWWYVETIMVIRVLCFQDYYNLPYHPETIKSDGM